MDKHNLNTFVTRKTFFKLFYLEADITDINVLIYTLRLDVSEYGFILDNVLNNFKIYNFGWNNMFV